MSSKFLALKIFWLYGNDLQLKAGHIRLVQYQYDLIDLIYNYSTRLQPFFHTEYYAVSHNSYGYRTFLACTVTNTNQHNPVLNRCALNRLCSIRLTIFDVPC